MTLDEVIFEMLADNAKVVDEIRLKFKAGMTVDQLIAMSHFGYGMRMRNKLNLWQPESGPLRKELWERIGPERQARYNKHWAKYPDTKDKYQGENMHADDASSELLREVLITIRDSEVKP